MTRLPAGWEVAQLDELVSTERHSLAIGPFGSNLKVSDYRTEGVPLVFVRNIRARDFDLVPTFVSCQKASELDAHRVDPGDVLVTKMGDPPGDTAIYPAGRLHAVLTADCIKARPHPAIPASYLSLALRSPSCASQILAMTCGVAQQKVNLRKIRTLRVPVAPAAEQERIVAAIDEAFSKLDAGDAGLRNAQQLLKRMRAAVLAAAVAGQIVPQELNDTGAAELLTDFDVELVDTGVCGLPALPDGWVWSTLGALSESIRNGIFVSRPPDTPPGVPILRIGAVRPLEIDLGQVRYAPVDPGDPSVRRALLAPGDLLLTRYNGNREFVGACAVVPEVKGWLLHPDKLIRVVVDRRVVDPNYVAIAASAGASRFFIERVTKTSAGQAGIAGGDLKRMPIPVPPMAEQARIVTEVERQLSFISASERSVKTGLEVSAALRRSVLRVAFDGGLVPQDPADEPAAALLERIRAEREAASKPTKRSARTTA